MLRMASGDSITGQKKHIICGNVLSVPSSSGHFIHTERFGSPAVIEPHIFHLLLQLYSSWISFLSISAQFNSTESTQTLDLQPAFIWTAQSWVHFIFRQADQIQSIAQISSADYIRSLDQISNNIYTVHRHRAKLSRNPHPAISGLRIAGT